MSRYQNDDVGFDPNQSIEGGFEQENFSTQQTTPSKKRTAKKFSNDQKQITPVTVRQLFGAKMTKDEAFEIHGIQVGTITLVGKIVSLIEKENFTSYMIDDSTGIIETKIWFNDNYMKGKKNEWRYVLKLINICVCFVRVLLIFYNSNRENKYVRIYGHLRQWESKNSIVAFRCSLITDFNEITFHQLDVIHAYLFNIKGSLPSVNPREWESNSTMKAENGAVDPLQTENHIQDKFQSYMDDAHVSEFDNVCNAVLAYIRTAGTSIRGVHLNDVCDHLSDSFTRHDIVNAINHLGDEGKIYNSIDEYHLKSSS
jgi:replication factor A2